MYKQDSIAALATASGVGALAIIRISGQNLKSLYKKITNNKPLVDRYARLSSIYCPKTKEKLDSGIVIFYCSPNSFTGEDLIEINCHGGEYVSKSILSSLFNNGIRHAEPGEFSMRAFLNGKIDLTQAEAVAELISSKASLTGKNSLNNISGFVSNYVDNLRNNIKVLLTTIEHELDFYEGEIEETGLIDIKHSMQKIQADIHRAIETAAVGNILSSGARVVLFGPPNAGKSSLFNSILGLDRAIVSEFSGTTRDVVEAWVELAGFPICLVDTAGYWDTDDYLDSLGIEKTKEQVNSADYLILLDTVNPEALFKKLNLPVDKKKVLFVRSKIDLTEKKLINDENNCIDISVKTNTGVSKLTSELCSRLSRLNTTSTKLDPIIASKRQRALLEEALSIVDRGIVILKNEVGLDVMASSLHELNDKLAEIIGEITNDEVVTSIFSDFCVGK